MKQFNLSCPLCSSFGYLRLKSRLGKNRMILGCSVCGGLSMFPSEPINYTDSNWTKKRTLSWDADVARSRAFAPKIIDFYRRLTGKRLNTILEIGCGTGFMGIGFTQNGCRYTGTEIDETLISFGRTKGITIHSTAAENLDSTFLSHSFDLVLSSNVFEHLVSPARAFTSLAHIKPSLSVIIVPNPFAISAVLKTFPAYSFIVNKIWNYTNRSMYTIDGVWHNIAYSKRSLEYFSSLNGFRVISLKKITTNHPTFGFVQPCNNVLYRCFSLFSRIIRMQNLLCMISKHP